MRATISLDDDVTKLLESAIQESGYSFDQAVNRFLFLGLAASSKHSQGVPFVVEPLPLGLPDGHDKISELLEILEGPDR